MTHRTGLDRFSLLPLQIFLIGLGLDTATWAGSPSAACFRTAIAEPPTFAIVATQDADETKTLAIDIAEGHIRGYDDRGQVAVKLSRPGGGQLEFSRPAQLVRTKDGYLVHDVPAHLVWLDASFRPTRSFRFDDATDYPPGDLDLIADLVPSGDHVFAHGVIKLKTGWRMAVLRLTPRRPGKAEVLLEIPNDGKEDQLYTLYGDYLAGAAGRVYFLRMSDPPQIVDVSSRPAKPLRSFPSGFEHMPRLPKLPAPDEMPGFFRSIYAAKMPRGLYSDGSYLFLLLREPAEDGTTLWRLSQIDPAQDRLLRTVTLPTAAADLVVAPGAHRWTFIEQGPRVEAGVRPTLGLLGVPTEWLTRDDSPLVTTGASKLPCR